MIYAEGPGLKPNSMGIWQNESGYLLYEDAEDIQPGDHILSDLPREERDRNCREAYQHLINRKPSVELLASTDDNSQPAGEVGNEDSNWEEDSPAPMLVIRRAWDREEHMGSAGSRGADDGSGGRTG